MIRADIPSTQIRASNLRVNYNLYCSVRKLQCLSNIRHSNNLPQSSKSFPRSSKCLGVVNKKTVTLNALTKKENLVNSSIFLEFQNVEVEDSDIENLTKQTKELSITGWNPVLPQIVICKLSNTPHTLNSSSFCCNLFTSDYTFS